MAHRLTDEAGVSSRLARGLWPMTPAERAARRFLRAPDHGGDADDPVRRIADLDQTTQDFAGRARILANAAKVVDVVRDHIVAAMTEGVVAADEIRRMERMSKLSAEARRWI